MNRGTDDPEQDFTHKRIRCIDHENRLFAIEDKAVKIDKRQERIYVDMYGPNGDPKEGYIFKQDQFLRCRKDTSSNKTSF
jgi:hypothetical protein